LNTLELNQALHILIDAAHKLRPAPKDRPKRAVLEQPTTAHGIGHRGAGRRREVEAYIKEVLDKKGKRITRTDIWKNAGYKTRTEFERWERDDPRNQNKTAGERFRAILFEKPHLK
jgi:hypothetical protein